MPDGKKHWRTLRDEKYIKAFDLEEKDVTLEIAKVVGEQLHGDFGTSGCPVVYFKNAKKGFVINVTNGTTIEGLYGEYHDDWVGKKITLYATKRIDRRKGGEVAAIAVRPKVPA